MTTSTCKDVTCDKNTDGYHPYCMHHYLGWLRNQPTYRGVHENLRATRGPAKGHECLACPKLAQDWAYIKGDIHERCEPWKKSSSGMKHLDTIAKFSTNLAYYVPLCKICHYRFDRSEDADLDRLCRWIRKLAQETQGTR